MVAVPSGDELSSCGSESAELDDSGSSGSEYIDDFPSDTPLMLNDYSVFESVKSTNDVVSRIYCDNEDSDLFGKSTSYPEKCIAFGPRLYFGQVGAENHFEVSTKGAGEGPLSVSIQGPHRGAVVKVSVTYTGLDNYTVMYKVIEPGYYIVAIRWANWPIPDSPIMCKVTP